MQSIFENLQELSKCKDLEVEICTILHIGTSVFRFVVWALGLIGNGHDSEYVGVAYAHAVISLDSYLCSIFELSYCLLIS